MNRETHKLDAAGIALGRLATQVAVLLRGKNKPGFVKHIDAGDFVVIKNFKDIKITGKKLEQKKDYKYSGYMGGLTATPLKRTMAERPAKALRDAVYRMLPKNKLRDLMIKRLTVRK